MAPKFHFLRRLSWVDSARDYYNWRTRCRHRKQTATGHSLYGIWTVSNPWLIHSRVTHKSHQPGCFKTWSQRALPAASKPPSGDQYLPVAYTAWSSMKLRCDISRTLPITRQTWVISSNGNWGALLSARYLRTDMHSADMLYSQTDSAHSRRRITNLYALCFHHSNLCKEILGPQAIAKCCCCSILINW